MIRSFKYLALTSLVLSISFLALTLLGSSSSSIRYKAFNKKRFVYLRDVASYYGLSCWVEKNRTFIHNKNKTWQITFIHDKKEVSFNGVKLYLTDSIFNQGVQSYMSEDDFWLTIDPLLRSKSLKKHSAKTIVIDPGHGGKDLGGNNRLANEKDLVLRMAKRTADLFRSRGYHVILTRSRDVNMALQERVNYAQSIGASLFISIHSNMAPSAKAAPSIHGLETFCMTPAGASSTHGGTSSVFMPGNRYDRNNVALAYEVHRSIISRTKSNDRGIKRARFLVLKQISCPAILIETGFLSHPREGPRLLTNAYQNAIATGIVEGVDNYYRRIRAMK